MYASFMVGCNQKCVDVLLGVSACIGESVGGIDVCVMCAESY